MQPELSVSPQSVLTPGGSEGADGGWFDYEHYGGDLQCEDVNHGICPVEEEDEDNQESQEGAPAKPLKSPSAPSRREMLEHSLTHCPCRSWCPHFVKGKSKASKHTSTEGLEESTAPVVGFDYAFMSDRISKNSNNGDEHEVSQVENDNDAMEILVGHDSMSRACAAI